MSPCVAPSPSPAACKTRWPSWSRSIPRASVSVSTSTMSARASWPADWMPWSRTAWTRWEWMWTPPRSPCSTGCPASPRPWPRTSSPIAMNMAPSRTVNSCWKWAGSGPRPSNSVPASFAFVAAATRWMALPCTRNPTPWWSGSSPNWNRRWITCSATAACCAAWGPPTTPTSSLACPPWPTS